MATVKKNQIIKTNITDLTDLGFGVGRVDGAVIFISDTVPGDEVEARVIKVNSSYLVGRVEKFIKKSALRVSDRCTESGCKSCAYRSISYAEELKQKRDGVCRLFATEELKHVRVADIIGSPDEKRYRNKAQYPITRTKERWKTCASALLI